MLLRALATALLVASSLTPLALIPAGGQGPADAEPVGAQGSVRQPDPVWSSGEGMAAPESAYYDAASNAIYVSNIAGEPAKKDNAGFIQKLDTQGKIIAERWAEGLDAPKGLAVHRGTLYVSDIDMLVSFDLKTGKLLQKLALPKAQFLNDVTVGEDGAIYVSDTASSAIYVVRDGKPKIFAEGEELESPNGLLVDKGRLIVASWGKTKGAESLPGRLLAIDLKTKELEILTPQPLGKLDGLVRGDDGGYLVSDWVAGQVYRISPEGQATVILGGMKGSADLGVVPEKNLLLVPRMGEDLVSAFDLEKLPK